MGRDPCPPKWSGLGDAHSEPSARGDSSKARPAPPIGVRQEGGSAPYFARVRRLRLRLRKIAAPLEATPIGSTDRAPRRRFPRASSIQICFARFPGRVPCQGPRRRKGSRRQSTNPAFESDCRDKARHPAVTFVRQESGAASTKFETRNPKERSREVCFPLSDFVLRISCWSCLTCHFGDGNTVAIENIVEGCSRGC